MDVWWNNHFLCKDFESSNWNNHKKNWLFRVPGFQNLKILTLIFENKKYPTKMIPKKTKKHISWLVSGSPGKRYFFYWLLSGRRSLQTHGDLQQCNPRIGLRPSTNLLLVMRRYFSSQSRAVVIDWTAKGGYKSMSLVDLHLFIADICFCLSFGWTLCHQNLKEL